MAKEIIVAEGQTLTDIALQYLGDVAGVPVLASRNGLSINYNLSVNEKLYYEDSDVINENLALFFSGSVISTGDGSGSENPPEPIDITPPEFVYGPVLTVVDTNSAQIRFEVNEQVTGFAGLWLGDTNVLIDDLIEGTEAYQFATFSSSAYSSFDFNFSNLQQNTTYTFTIVCEDLFGNQSIIKKIVFTTKEVVAPSVGQALPYPLPFVTN